MSAIETIRDIPVIIQHRKQSVGDGDQMDLNFDHDYISGFPFDNTNRRSRDPLEDIAQRHPEFAQHLQGFPRRTQRNQGDQDEDEFLRRRFERPFSSGRFERFGFPFNRDDFEREPQRYYEAYPEHFANFQNQPPNSPPHQQNQSTSQSPPGYQQYPPQYGQTYQPTPQNEQKSQQPQQQFETQQSVSTGTQTEDCASEEGQCEKNNEEVPQEQKSESGQNTRASRPIQQSNTCDLAQHQPPDEALNEREQRSMSAPPENKRFTSSVNIPMGVGNQTDGRNSPSSHQGARSQAGSGSTERVIPIHVEGRDDPVIPKHRGPTPTQSQPQSERIFTDNPQQQQRASQPETIFGRRPEAFTQYVHRDPHKFANDWPHHTFGGFPEEEFGFRRTESPTRFSGGAKPQQQHHQQQQTQRPQQATPPPSQKPQPPAEQKPEPQKQPEQKPQPQKTQQQPLGPIEQIQAIQKDVSALLGQVESFQGAPRDKHYLYLDEMLTRNLLKLDNVDTQGQDSIRSARKEAIKCIEKGIGLLETRANANAAPKVEMEQGQDAEESQAMSPAPADENKSDENMEQVDEELKGEEASVEHKEENTVEDNSSKQEEEGKEGVPEGEKKEKKKIKKKANKDEKKQ